MVLLITVHAFPHARLLRPALRISFLLLFGLGLVVVSSLMRCLLEGQLGDGGLRAVKRCHIYVGFLVATDFDLEDC